MKKRWFKWLFSSLAIILGVTIISPIVISCSNDTSSNNHKSNEGADDNSNNNTNSNARINIPGIGNFVNNNAIDMNNPVPDLIHNSLNTNIIPNTLSPNLVLNPNQNLKPNYNNSNLLSSLSFTQTKYDVKQLNNSLCNSYNICDVSSFCLNFINIINDNLDIFNNQFSNINPCDIRKYIEFKLSINSASPEVTVNIHLMNKKIISATFYGFNNTSINNNGDVLLNNIYHSFSLYLKNFKNIINKINQNKPIDYINDYYKLKTGEQYQNLLKSITLNKLFKDATSNDYIEALKQYWGYDKLNDILTSILYSSDNFMIKNNLEVMNKDYVVFSYNTYSDNAKTLIIDKNIIKNLTWNDFLFSSTTNSADDYDAHSEYKPYNTLIFKLKNYNTNFVELNIPVSDSHFATQTDQEFLNYFNNRLNSYLKNLIINRKLFINKDLLNYGWFLKCYILNKRIVPVDNFDNLYKILKSIILSWNSSNFRLISNPKIDDFHLSTNNQQNLVINLNDASVTTNIKFNYDLYQANLNNDMNEFVNGLNTQELKNKTINISKQELMKCTQNYEVSNYLNNLIYNCGLNDDLNTLFLRMIEKKYHVTNINDTILYFYNFVSLDYTSKKDIINTNGLVSGSFNLGYDSAKNKIYLYCSDYPYKTSVYYLDITINII